MYDDCVAYVVYREGFAPIYIKVRPSCLREELKKLGLCGVRIEKRT